jgi:quercetin dioxygenase-like cupin family protein
MPSRRSLLQQTILAGSFLSPAFMDLLAASAQMPANEQWYWYPGHSFTIRADGKATADMATWMLVENSPHEGVPFHKHLHEDESFYVIDGEFEITIGDATTTGGPGTFAYGPRNVPHRWTNVGSRRGRILSVFNPSGIEGYFLAVSVPIKSPTDNPHVDVAELQARSAPLREKFGIVRTGGLKFDVAGPTSK